MSRTVEIIGRYEGERMRFANDDGSSVVIGSLRASHHSKEILSSAGLDPDGSITIKGEDDDTLEPSNTYRFIGTFSNYFNRRLGRDEKQFHFRTFVSHVPHDADGMIRYLVENGKGNGIGPSKAKKLVDHFGVDSVLVECRSNPDLVSKICNIDPEFAGRFAAKLEARKATENAKIELDNLLSGRNFPRSLPGRLIKEWGNKAADVVRTEPYRLMQFRGVGFKLADRLYMELGHDPRSLLRQSLFLWYTMARDNSGHSWFPADTKVRELQKSIGGAEVDYRSAIKLGRELGKIDVDYYGAIATLRTDRDHHLRENGELLWLAEGKVASQEEELATMISEALTEKQTAMLTIYEDTEVVESIPASVARCARCGRALTADEVYVFDGKPYGPTCIERVTQ